MDASDEDDRLAPLAAAAEELGADEARVIDPEDIVLDGRVRLKCAVPLCASYGRHMMCPPNLMGVEEFAAVLRSYKRALLVQVVADVDSSDKSGDHLDGGLCADIERSTGSDDWSAKLHMLVNRLETHAFKQGFYLAAGFIGGNCSLCEECVVPGSGEPCRHPFEARPSMEAMGMDVVRTCRNAGLPMHLSSGENVRWTGLVLLD